MLDQANGLREKMKNQQPENPGRKAGKKTRVLAVTSGKGGVGKSNFALNFALSLIEQNKKVLIFDVDLGFANIEVLLGILCEYANVIKCKYSPNNSNEQSVHNWG